MSSTTPCVPCCDTPQTTNIPGAAGASAFTTTSASFVVPAAGANVTIAVVDTSWMSAGLNLWIPSGNYKVAAVISPTSVSVTFLAFDGDTASGTTIIAGTLVVAGTGNVDLPLVIANGGTGQSTRLAAITALINSASIAAVNNFTDNTTGTAGDTMAAGVGRTTLAFYFILVDIAANGDLLTNYTPGYRFKILSVDFALEKAVTTAARRADFNLEIGTTNLTGGVVSVTSAAATPQGVVIAGSAVTANNIGTSTDNISIEASNVTAHAEGSGWLLIRIQNMDSADAFASIASKVNSLYNALKT